MIQETLRQRSLVESRLERDMFITDVKLELLIYIRIIIVKFKNKDFV